MIDNMNSIPKDWHDPLAKEYPLPPIDDVLQRLETLYHKLDKKGRSFQANTVALALETIRRGRAHGQG